MAAVTSRARAVRGRAFGALTVVALAAGLAALPAVASAAPARAFSPSRTLNSAGGHSGPELTALARARAGLRGQARRTSAITGTVVGPYGLPVTGACVTAVGRARSVTASAAPSGAFTIAGLTAGSYALEYRDCRAAARYRAIWSGGAGWQRTAARVQLRAGQLRHVPGMMLPANPAALSDRTATWHRFLANASGRGLTAAAAAKTGEISGVVTGNGKKLRGVCVVVFPLRSGEGYGATTRKNGTYVVRHVPAGRYNVIFAGFFCGKDQNWLQQVYRDDNNPFGIGGTPVRVTSGRNTKGIDARLRLGGEISGTVTTKSGRKLGGICVNAGVAVPNGFIGITLPTSDGSYQLNALYPGKWSVNFTIGCGNNKNYAPAALKPIKITYGQRVVARTVVLVPGGVFTGTVRLGSSSGTPLAGICVQASNGADSGSVTGGGPGPGSGATNSAGRYRLIGLGTGTYQVQFFPGCNNNGNYTAATKYAHATAGKVTGGVNAVLLPAAEISGVVTDTHGHQLAGICLNVNGPSSGNSPGATLTDGSYFVNQLSAGTYQLGFSTGCGNSGNYEPYWYNNQTNPSLATPIKLTRGTALTINAQMQPGAAISGTVTDSHGRKLTNICVDVTSASGFALGGIAFSEHGAYQVNGLTPGQYLVDFSCGGSPGYADQWFPNTPDAGAASMVSAPVGQTTGVNAVLRPAGSIAGVVRGPSGKPLAGVCVSASSTRDYESSTAIFTSPGPITNSRGFYRLAGLGAGRYIVSFYQCTSVPRYPEQWFSGQASVASAKPVPVRAGATTAGIDATLRPGATVTGRVVNSSGKPVSYVCVTAYNLSTSQFGFASTGKSGSYVMRAVATGSYTLSFAPCGLANLVAVYRHIKVTAPHTYRGVDARLVPGGSASGVVTLAGAAAPVANTCVEFIRGNPASPTNPVGFGFTAANGRYLAAGMPPGSYQVYFNDPLCGLGPNDLAPQWYNDQPTQATAAKVTINLDQTTPGIDAALQPDGAISGTVLGPSSKALSGACATAMPVAAGSVPIVAVSGKSGAFTLIDLLPGRYKVEFSSGCGASGYRTQWWQNAGSRQHATPVMVSAAQTVSGINAKLAR
ncbi:MAG: carboxypeptidase regulatory-like domain-containing protein [Streptosporangiaceae bacterium]